MRIRNIEQFQEQTALAKNSPQDFWNSIAQEYEWFERPKKIFEGDLDQAFINLKEENIPIEWFKDGQLNITVNCIDRHLKDRADQTAIIFEPNQPDAVKQTLTYQELANEVNRCANALKELGIKKGDRVCLYMSMVPELAIAVLACARIGAVHSVVFGGFSAQALADRINDCQADVLLTVDGTFRGNKYIPLKAIADEALQKCPNLRKNIVVKRSFQPIDWHEGRDVWWHELMESQSTECPAEVMNAEDPLFILYTSGSTGKPKGLLLTCGGYMVYVGYSFQNVFQIDRENAGESVYWCSADIGWITGHSYLVYGPLLQGTTTIVFEGVPTYPNPARFWQVIDKHQVTHFYTAPTAIRALEQCDSKHLKGHSLDSLKVLGTVGEPINDEAWQWYFKNIGKGRCPIVDTWWQTETGGIMITPLPEVHECLPTFASYPLPGITPELVEKEGNTISEETAEGYLCFKRPWPSIARSIYGDHERYIQTYFSEFPGFYFSGDGAKRQNGSETKDTSREAPLLRYRITGRVDDVINVSGHRIGTAEVEDAINQTTEVVESAVVGFPHPIKGQALFAYVVPFEQEQNTAPNSPDKINSVIAQQVSQSIGSFAKPERVLVVSALPKTRSGKIMRRILRKIAEGDSEHLGDTSTLLDPSVVEQIKKKAEVFR